MTGRPLISLLGVTLLVAASGASCPKRMGVLPPAAPVVFRQPPTLPEVIQAVNSNSARVQQLQTTSATLSVPGLPTLRASLALDRPKRFRLRAETGLTGAELDLGSNDEMLWMWVRRQQPPTVFYARHQQFPYTAARQILPVPPHWLIDALGVVELDPHAGHQGPYMTSAGRLEVRTPITSADGQLTRITVVDDTYGWVLEQHLYDAQGTRLASALASQHRYEPVHGVSLPRHIDVYLPPAQLSFSIQVDNYSVNQLYADPAQLWAMPRLDGHRYVDLAQPPAGVPSVAARATPGANWQNPVYPRPTRSALRRLPAFGLR